VLLGAAGATVLILTAVKLEETHTPASVNLASMIGFFVRLLRSRAFLSFTVATAFTSACWFTFLAAAPYLLAERLREPPSTYGLMILLPMAGYIQCRAAVGAPGKYAAICRWARALARLGGHARDLVSC
jgi:MFS transporter, DHA1 family, multidrug resistance protein